MNTLKTNKITPTDGCINICQDSTGKFYKIPNFCINDPYFEKEILAVDTNRNSNIINISIYDLYEQKKTDLNIAEDALCIELKKMFCIQHNINIADYRIRFLFGGVELKDELHIYQHKVLNGYTIQCLKTPIS